MLLLQETSAVEVLDQPLDQPLIFVYGTLRPGQRAVYMLDDACHIGPGNIYGELYDLGGFPGAVIPDYSTDALIYGDVFMLPDNAVLRDALLSRLDRYEGVSSGLYRREQLAVSITGGAPGGVNSKALVYVYNQELGRAQRIAGGDWLAQRVKEVAR